MRSRTEADRLARWSGGLAVRFDDTTQGRAALRAELERAIAIAEARLPAADVVAVLEPAARRIRSSR